jgi:peptidoglycan-N-acetylglucosamine deacetylase
MPILITVLLAIAAGTVHWVWPRLWLQAGRRRLAAVCRAHRVVAITFDDGPGRLLTPLVSERLADAKVKGTFFLLANNVRGNEDIVEDLLRRGHEIGSHGERHVHHMWSWPWAGVLDTREGWRRLHDVTGGDVRGIPFRPPFGKLNFLSMVYVRRQHTPVVLWTHDSFDTRLGVDKSPEELAEELRQSGGGIVLLHDFDRSLANARQAVLAKLDAVLRLRDDGFRFVCASELVALSRQDPPAG